MKKKTSDDLRPEYDFSAMKLVGKGKYVRRYRAGSNVVLLSPDVAKVFPNARSVNEALRLVIKITKVAEKPKRRKAM